MPSSPFRRLRSRVLFVVSLCLIVIAVAIVSAAAPWYIRKSAASRIRAEQSNQIRPETRSFARNYGELLLSFERNDGQADARARFISRGQGYDLFLTATEAVLSLRKSQPQNQPVASNEPQPQMISVLRLKMIGANAIADVRGEDELQGKVNYFLGNDPQGWHIKIPTFRQVKYSGIFPSVDLVYYGNRRQLEYDFIVSPGGNPSAIQFEIDGAGKIRVGDEGDLYLAADAGEVRLHRPQIYQIRIDGSRDLIPGRYTVKGRRIGFKLGQFDSNRSLVIDPVLSYSTLLGTGGTEQGNGIAVDAQGNAYITGITSATNFPTTAGAFQTSVVAVNANAFVTKLDSTGSNLIYSTYLSGNSGATATAIAVDQAGDAYVCGSTQSADFPTVNAIRAAYNFLKTTDKGSTWNGLNFSPPSGVNVLRLDPQTPSTIYVGTSGGTGVNKSTDGGNSWTALSTGLNGGFVTALVVDPLSPGTLYAANNGGSSGVLKSTNGGTSWTLLTGLSGTGFIYSLAIDPVSTATLYLGSNGGLFKTVNGGSTWTRNPALPTIANALAIDPSTPATVYAGGGGGIFKSTDGSATWTASSNGLPSTNIRALAIDPTQAATIYAGTNNGVFKSTNAGGNWGAANTGIGNVAIVSLAIDPSTSSTIYAGSSTGKIFKTIDGGSNWMVSYSLLATSNVAGLAVDPLAPARVYAGTVSTGIPDTEAFVTKLNPAGSGLVFSTFLGGSNADSCNGIALDSSQNVYVAGSTNSTDFLTTNAFQAASGGGGDGFVAKINAAGGSLSFSTYLGGSGNDAASAIAVDAGGNAYITGSTTSANFPLAGAFQSAIGDQFSLGDAFATKLGSTGSLVYSTFLGGNQADTGYAIACDSSGNAYVTGQTLSSNFPTANAIQSTNGGGASDAFITKLNNLGSALVYSTFFGGSNTDSARAIAVDSSGSAYVAGFTSSSDFPLVAGSLKNKSPFYRTLDKGSNWSNDSYGLKSDNVTAMAINPVTPSTIFAGTRKSIFKSTDAGRTWSPSMAGLTNPNVTSLAINPLTPSIMYAGITFTDFASSNGCYKSTDGGNSWSPANNGLGNGSVTYLAIDPITPSTLYALTQGFVLYKTTDSGANWNPIGPPPPFFAMMLAIDPVTPTTLYAANNFSGGTVSKSTDGGTTWQVMNNGLTASGVRYLAIDPVTPATVYAGGFSGGLFKSVNGGTSWTSINPGVFGPIAIDPVTPTTLYACSNSGVIFKSTDGGSTWSAMNNGLQASTISALVVNPVNPKIVYAGVIAVTNDEDVFVSKLNSSGTSLVYSTLVGGVPTSDPSSATLDEARGIALDTTGNAYLTGVTSSTNFPTGANSYQPFNRGFSDAFVSKLTMSYIISGQVVDGSNAPVSGAEVTLSDGTNLTAVTTESDGSYQFPRLREGGNFTVSAAKPHFTMAPPSQSFNNLTSNQTLNFVATATNAPFFTISGQISNNGAGLGGLSVTLGGSQQSTTTTDTTGNYSFTVAGGGNYSVTPAMLGFVFTPVNQTFNNLSANQTGDFAATRQNFVVTNANDHGDGSLRQAILNANATPGLDTVTFNIPASGVQTINLLLALPTITDPVVIDATTQPGYAGVPLIELNGTQASSSSGFQITAGSSTIRGFIINKFISGSGISMTTNGGNTIQANYIGIDASGTVRRNNNTGVSLSGSLNNLIGGTTAAARNVISGNSFDGIVVGGAGNQIQGNFIGTNSAGSAAIPNGINGVNISGSPQSTNNVVGGSASGAGNVISGNQTGVFFLAPGNTVQGNLIGTDVTGLKAVPNGTGISAGVPNTLVGGLVPGARNVISGNTGDGVSIGGSGSVLQGNLIGTDITGSAALGNGGTGLNAGTSALIGGTVAAARNIISGNGGFGNVSLGSSGTGPGATVQGNYIGTDITGNVALNSLRPGISISGSSNIIGGLTPDARNIISGNTVGIQIGGNTTALVSANVVQGNFIGLNQAGTSPLPNSSDGIRIDNLSSSGAANNVIGGTAAGAGNTISFNGGNGVVVSSSTGNAIRGNSIFSNGGLGIDLAPAGINANDQGDADTGANNRQNFPVLTSLTPPANPATITGTLNSTPNAAFTIDFYSNTSCDPSGNGEGAQFLANTTVTTAADGNATISFTLMSALPPGTIITATATDPAGNTSEFSPCVSGAIVSFSQSSYAVDEGAGSINLTVNRSGDTTLPVNVDYATSDGGASLVPCSTANGQASSKCDFTDALGTLRFAAGETSKTVTLLVSQDNYVEGPETFTIGLANATAGATLGSPFMATITINDDVTEPPGNVIDDPGNFVRQHYHDFLNREADQSGLDFWTGQMTNCGASDFTVCRVNVSGAFFLSIEFQQTGYLVERMYKVAYGNATGVSTLGGVHQLAVPRVRFNEFLKDTQRIGQGVVVLQPGWEQALENNKQAYAGEFVATSRFVTAFPTSTTPALFVDRLNQNAGNVLSASERTAAINLFNGSADTSNTTARAQAVRQVAEDPDLYKAESNRAFVLAQYFGYLRRNPNDPQDTDYTGYEFWLNKLNQFNGDYIGAEMVKAFISSNEYRQRFGP